MCRLYFVTRTVCFVKVETAVVVQKKKQFIYYIVCSFVILFLLLPVSRQFLTRGQYCYLQASFVVFLGVDHLTFDGGECSFGIGMNSL